MRPQRRTHRRVHGASGPMNPGLDQHRTRGRGWRAALSRLFRSQPRQLESAIKISPDHGELGLSLLNLGAQLFIVPAQGVGVEHHWPVRQLC